MYPLMAMYPICTDVEQSAQIEVPYLCFVPYKCADLDISRSVNDWALAFQHVSDAVRSWAAVT